MPNEIGLFPPPYCSYLANGFCSFQEKPVGNSFPFFLSFEDALGEILSVAKPSAGSTFLYPSFFCMDVVEFVERRGLNGIAYTLDKNLNIDLEDFNLLIQKEKPALIFLYHPLGKRSNAFKNTDWLNSLPSDCILIEDCADCLLEEEGIELLNQYHFVVDSLRKVSPFQGARVFAPDSYVLAQPQAIDLHSNALHCIVRLINLLTSIVPWRPLLELKWNVFSSHSDRIGKSPEPLRGSRLGCCLFKTLNLKKIKSARRDLITVYQLQLATLFQENKDIATIPLEDDDLMELRFFPLLARKGYGDTIATKLEQFGIYVDTHFNDSPFGEHRDCLLLPLWPNFDASDIIYICSSIYKCQ